jgi:hypothetical protein
MMGAARASQALAAAATNRAIFQVFFMVITFLVWYPVTARRRLSAWVE